ncbi:hypothetical protein ACFQZI_10920 [Mucilaginibacter lutimaris]|uniref:Uncharacterized protein n=1 Tax=Mucilaginibacter lutimaris TaxID=931629 RepID=A0ABW2ZGN9_9SPHI
MYQEDENQETKSYVKIDVEGSNPQIWSKMKSKLTDLIMDALEFNINVKTGASLKDEIGRASSNLIEFANAKLEKPSIENHKMLAEIENILAEKAKQIAEARKLHAEAEEKEFELFVKKFKFALGCAKAFAIQSKDQEFLVFTKNVEELTFIFQENKALE